ncbi:MAG: hypothetical protein V3V35_07835, partial [Dehalococcoidia bacterium]
EPEEEEEESTADQEDPTAFDFDEEMRKTRLRVDELLAQGKIEEAETYMEERRQFLAEHGFYFRKLNQAFFAFHGTYATRPGRVSPVGDQVKAVRQESVTLGQFLSRMAGYASFESFLRDLEARE